MSDSARGRPVVPFGQLAAVFTGGALGTLARDGVEHWIGTTNGGWPTATLLVNLVGAFLLGALIAGLGERQPLMRLGLGTGVLGGFTTYSTLAVETALLGHHDRWGYAVAYPLASVVGGIVAVVLGVWLARRVVAA